MKVGDWRYLCHDSSEHLHFFEREVTRDDGKTVVQVATLDDRIKRPLKKAYIPSLKLHHQYVVKDNALTVRPMSAAERKRAASLRGRGMGVQPSTVIVSLSEQHGFVASVCGDVDGGLGTYESDERSGL